jgi:hypothetical protein
MPTSPATTGHPSRRAEPAARTGRSRARSALTANAAQTAVNAMITPSGQALTGIGNGHISAPSRLPGRALRP